MAKKKKKSDRMMYDTIFFYNFRLSEPDYYRDNQRLGGVYHEIVYEAKVV